MLDLTESAVSLVTNDPAAADFLSAERHGFPDSVDALAVVVGRSLRSLPSWGQQAAMPTAGNGRLSRLGHDGNHLDRKRSSMGSGTTMTSGDLCARLTGPEAHTRPTLEVPTRPTPPFQPLPAHGMGHRDTAELHRPVGECRPWAGRGNPSYENHPITSGGVADWLTCCEERSWRNW